MKNVHVECQDQVAEEDEQYGIIYNQYKIMQKFTCYLGFRKYVLNSVTKSKGIINTKFRLLLLVFARQAEED